MPFEKTSELNRALNVLNVTSAQSIKVRLTSTEPPNFVLFSQDRNLLQSMSEGIKRHIGKTSEIWELDQPDGGKGFQLQIRNIHMQQICKNAKLNFDDIVKELKREDAYYDKMKIEPNPPSSMRP